MKHTKLIRKLIVRATPDLLADIYARIRQGVDLDDGRVAWKEIAGKAQTLGILDAEEAHTFLHFVGGRFPESVETAGRTARKAN